MPKDHSYSRRKFLQQLGSTTLLMSAGSLTTISAEGRVEERILRYENRITANDQVNIACIGMGIMGFNNVKTALQVPGETGGSLRPVRWSPPTDEGIVR